MGKSQQVERSWTTVSWPVLVLGPCGRRTERHELRLGRVNAQTVLAEALRQDFQDALGIALIAKPITKSSASDLGYKCVVVHDACATRDQEFEAL